MGKFPQVGGIVGFAHGEAEKVGFSTVWWKSFPMGFPRRLTGVYGQFCTVSTGLTITTIIILGSFGAIPRRFAEKEKVRTFKSSVQKVRR